MARPSTYRSHPAAVVFGSQGTSALFSRGTVQKVEQYAATSTLAARVLSGCHAAFLSEASSIGLNASTFRSLQGFLAPPTKHRHNPIVQAALICLYQLLAFVTSVEQAGQGYETFLSNVTETIGFCSGLLPACAVASARNENEFIELAATVLRASVCIAHELHIYGAWVIPGTQQSDSWNLVIGGIDRSDLENKVHHIASEHIRIGAFIDKSTFSVSGPHPALLELKASLQAGTYSQFAHINCWYHGGASLEPVVGSVLQRLHTRAVLLPSAKKLRVPLRSTYDGTLYDITDDNHGGFTEWLVRHMAVLPMDIVRTAQGLAADLVVSPSQHGISLLCYGPKPDALFTNLRALCKNAPKIIDLSPFSNTYEARPSEDDIAIVGKAFDLPGAQSDQELLDMLVSRTCAASEIPESRFNVNDYLTGANKPNSHRSMNTKWGAFLKDIWSFDNEYFSISPREAKSMDPQQRILLTVAKSALEDAGYVEDASPSFQRSTMGCYVGVATGDYTDNLKNDIDVFYSPGTLRAFHAGRISFVNKFSGPAMVTDTACSSSLVSIYQACRALAAGDCRSAVAGGVNTVSSPDMYLGLSRAHFLSSTGCCKPFDAGADGYCRAEGCAVFVLKRLSDAIKEGDHIHGVIKGVAVNNSGNASSITHPHSGTQVQLMKQVLQTSKMDANAIGVIEAHGTGTQAGDAGEMKSLIDTFGQNRSTKNPVYISSIKGNIGHAEAASGAAGLAKLLLMLKKSRIYPQASCTRLNPQFSDSLTPSTIIPFGEREWTRFEQNPRRALLNNFGASGSNAALILEEYMPHSHSRAAKQPRSKYLFNLSALDSGRLVRLVEETRQHIASEDPRTEVVDICYSATARRKVYPHRMSLSCTSKTDLLAQLGNFDSSSVKPPRAPRKNLVFVFSGQGALYKTMGKELIATSPLFRDIIMECDEIMSRIGAPSILPYIDSENSTEYDRLSDGDQITVSQCACVSLEYALGKLFMSWGLRPTCLIGHSIGEYAALALSSAISLTHALEVVAQRGALLSKKVPPRECGMLAIRASCDLTEEILSENKSLVGLEIACQNSHDDCVVSGPIGKLHDLEQLCIKRQIKAKKLDVPFGFHSTSVQPIKPELELLGSSVKWSQPTLPVSSSLLGRMMTADDLSADHFARHACEPVRFASAVEAIFRTTAPSESTCLELGPHPITLPMVQAVLGSKDCLALPALRRDQKPWECLTATLSQLYMNGYTLDWREVFNGASSKMVPLPGHPLSGRKACVPFEEQRLSTLQEQRVVRTSLDYKLLVGYLKASEEGVEHEFHTSTHVLAPLIKGHRVGGAYICPASAYHEMCLEAVAHVIGTADALQATVEDMKFLQPLIHREGLPDQPLKLILQKNAGTDTVAFSASVCAMETAKPIKFFEAVVQVIQPPLKGRRWVKEASIVKRQSSYIRSYPETSVFQRRSLYEATFSRVVQYAQRYQALSDFVVCEDTLEGSGKLILPEEAREDGYILNPVFTDSLLHASGFIANTFVARMNEIFVCGHVGRVGVSQNTKVRDSHRVYTSLYETEDRSIKADSFAINKDGDVVAVVEGMHFKRIRLEQFHKIVDPGKPAQEAVTSVERTSDVSSSSSPSSSGMASATGPTLTPATTLSPASTSSPSRQPTPDNIDMHEVVAKVASAVSGFDAGSLDFSKPLETLGIDSLMQIELASSLQDSIEGVELDHSQIGACGTLQEVSDVVTSCVSQSKQSRAANDAPEQLSSQLPRGEPSEADKLQEPSSIDRSKPASSQILTRLYSSGTNATPLCLVHDGSGKVANYGLVSPMDRDVWAISDPSFGKDSAMFSTVEDMAEYYVSQLLGAGLTSVIIGGWSFGGVVAFLMVQKLKQEGVHVTGLLLVDSPSPINHQPLPKSIVSYVLDNGPAISPVTRKSLEINFNRCAEMLGKLTPDGSSAVDVEVTMLQSEETLDTEGLCGVKYGWISDQIARRDTVSTWQKVLGTAVGLRKIPGNHFEAFGPHHVETTAAVIREACNAFGG